MSSAMGPPAKPPPKLTPKDLEHHNEYYDRIGRYKTTEEIESEGKSIQSYWVEINEARPYEWKRPPSKVQSRFTVLKEEGKERKFPEYDDYWHTKLLDDLNQAGGVIRNIVAMDLGSLCYSEEHQFEIAARAHLFAFNILKVLSDAANKSKESGKGDPLRGAVFVCEDVRYGKYDLNFLHTDYLSDGREGWLSDRRIRPYTSNEGMGWWGTDGGNGDYIFITLNPRNPIRQYLARLLSKTENLTDSERAAEQGTLMGKLIKPRAIICRDANKSGEYQDPTDPHVKDWFKTYYDQVHKFEDEKIFGGDIWLYTLKSEIKGNAPSASSVQGSA